LNISKGKS